MGFLKFYATLWIFFLPMQSPVSAIKRGHIYYMDSTNGNDINSGLIESKAWKTLERANKHMFMPGDKLLFKSGLAYSGQLSPKGSGKLDHPIQIDRYGKGAKPRIMGNGTEAAAVHLLNVEHWTIKNLDITNHNASNKSKRYGVWIQLKNFGTAHNISLINLDVHDVNGSLVKKEGGGAGILCSNEGTIRSRFQNLSIEGCTIKRTQRNGILINGNWERTKWFPSLNVVIRKNLLEGVPGDGIVPIGCDGALIEYNTMRDCPRLLPEGEAAAGIWPWSCDNTIIQYNEVSGHKAPADAQGFDSDWNCRNTIIQYNYSHDNEGGFLLVCNDGNSKGPNNAGNTGTIIRYNLSVNDGFRATGRAVGFSPVIHFAGPVRNTRIYNNTIYVASRTGKLDSTLVDITNWGGYADSTLFANNIFYSKTSVDYSLSKGTRTFFDHNLYAGKHVGRPVDPLAILTDPGFIGPIVPHVSGLKQAVHFKLRSTSPASKKGRRIADKPIQDFFGNAVPMNGQIDIGIHQKTKN